MKFSILNTADNAYRFAVTENGKHSSVEAIPTLTEALHLTLAELKTAVSKTSGEVTGSLAAPIAPEIELWGAGVTYLRSRDARKEESGVPDVYQRVYEADRPELFFKSTAVRARGTGAPIGIRYGICNDVTSRSIEGENPLYLSQAKIYVGSTSLGPDITPAWLAPSAAEMTIKAKILRGASTTWEAQTSLGQLNRTLEDLVDYLFRCQDFPHGVILSTGTGIVPPMDIALAAGDIVEIDVAGVGILSNVVEVIPERVK
jgi:2-dehydro-3-deoxy-D-arabinonate dehydratase